MRRLKFILFFIILLFLLFLIYLNFNYSTPILMYHSLDAKRINEYASISPQVFYKQMKFIKEKKIEVIPLEDYCEKLKHNLPIPRNTVIITFDDGYKDIVYAIEILKKFNYPATVFLVKDFIGKEGFLDKNDILNFLKNTKIKIGSHTIKHSDLSKVNEIDLKEEILGSKKALTEMFSYNITTISYPFGSFNERVLKETKEAGYICGCTTNRGFSAKINRFALRRIKITNRDLGIRFWAKISGFYLIFKKVKNPY